MNKEELKNCPFCGGPAREQQVPGSFGGYGLTEVTCRSCGATAPSAYKWNRRAYEVTFSLEGVAPGIERIELDDTIEMSIGELIEIGNRCWWHSKRYWQKHPDGRHEAETIHSIIMDFMAEKRIAIPTAVTIWAYRQVSSGVWIISTDRELADGECYIVRNDDLEFDRFEVYAGWKPDSLYRYTVREVEDD